MIMRFLAALFTVLALGFAFHEAQAQGTDTLSCTGEVTYTEGQLPDAFSLPLSCTVTNTPEPPPPPPPPPSGDVIDAILAQPAGTWAPYGAAWSTLPLDRVADNCGPDLPAILGAWVGGAWDAGGMWVWAGGGHGDGCFNGILRYDIATGEPEVAVPHTPLNVPLYRAYQFDASGNPTDGWNEPYVSDTPWPGCPGVDPNCQDLTKADVLASGPVVDQNFLARDAQGQWTVPVEQAFGTMVRPRSSHNYNNAIRLGNYLYLMIGQYYGSGKSADMSVWRYDLATGAIDRLPDRPDVNFNANPTVDTAGNVRIFGGASVCDADMDAGAYNCTNNQVNFSNAATLVWDESRNGYWAVDTQFSRVVFTYHDPADNKWRYDAALSVTDTRLDKAAIGNAGICVVPTDTGTVPVIWGGTAALYRVDGGVLTEIVGQAGQPAAGASNVLSKWTWRDDLGGCALLQSWDEGLYFWRPDFSNWQAAETEPPAGNWPTFAGHTVAPAPVTLAAWDEPVTFQPEAPDIDGICPGPWTEFHYFTDADVQGSATDTRNLDHARVFLHAKPDGSAYLPNLKFDETRCSELIGVPDVDGNKPLITGKVSTSPNGAGGAIIRGIRAEGNGLAWSCSATSCPQFLVLQNNDIVADNLIGNSNPTLGLTYLEYAGNTVTSGADGHSIYLERSIGLMVARGNVFFASGTGRHSFKNLSHRSIIEGNVFSNVGIDGQVVAQAGNGDDIIGLAPLDLYLCTETEFRDNTVVFRTANITRAFLLYRARNAWNGCNKGQRLPDNTWEIWQPEDPDYFNATKWAEINTAVQAFGQGFAAARAEPWLFTHLAENNTFVVFNAHGGDDDTRAATMNSLRPLMDNTQEANIQPEYDALTNLCASDADPAACWQANAGPEALYVWNHMNPALHGALIVNADAPNNQPIEVPADWVERAGLFWGGQTYITCDAAGSDCAVTADRPVDAAPLPWDDVEVEHPPRLLPF